MTLPLNEAVASHDATLPLVCETYNQFPLRVRLCAYENPAPWEPERVQAILRALVEGTQLWRPMWVSVSVHGQLRPLGIFDPGSRVIMISTRVFDTPYLFYYVLGHELLHGVYDSRHISWNEQHCRMYKEGSELEPVRQLVRTWNPDVRENPAAIIIACLNSREDFPH